MDATLVLHDKTIRRGSKADTGVSRGDVASSTVNKVPSILSAVQIGALDDRAEGVGEVHRPRREHRGRAGPAGLHPGHHHVHLAADLSGLRALRRGHTEGFREVFHHGEVSAERKTRRRKK